MIAGRGILAKLSMSAYARSSRMSWPRTDPSLEYVPKMPFWIKIMKTERPFHTYFVFGTQYTYWQHESGADGRFGPLPQSPGQQHQHKGGQIPQ